MKITTVRYRRLQSHDRGYGHDAVEAEAQVEDGEDCEAVLDALKCWVLGRLGTIREVDQHLDNLQRLRIEVTNKERELTRLRDEVAANRKIISEHEKLGEIARERGIDAGNLIDDGIPF